MSVLLAVAGAGLLGMALSDMYVTTIAAAAGGGPLTRSIARGLWRLAKLGPRRHLHRRLRRAGNLILVGVALAWLVLIWGGFALLFLSDPASVVDSTTTRPVDVVGRLAYVAGGLAGAGARLIAGSSAWEALNNVAAILGLVWAALTVTYLIQAVLAASRERALASRILGTADDPVSLAALGAGQAGLGVLGQEIRDVTQEIAQMSRYHHTLPTLPYLHPGQRHVAIEVAMAVLDEALLLLTAIQPEVGTSVHPTRAVIAQFVATADDTGDATSPPTVDVGRARDAGLAVESEALRRRADAEDDRRRRLRALVEDRGWDWRRDVLGEPSRTNGRGAS